MMKLWQISEELGKHRHLTEDDLDGLIKGLSFSLLSQLLMILVRM